MVRQTGIMPHDTHAVTSAFLSSLCGHINKLNWTTLFILRTQVSNTWSVHCEVSTAGSCCIIPPGKVSQYWKFNFSFSLTMISPVLFDTECAINMFIAPSSCKLEKQFPYKEVDAILSKLIRKVNPPLLATILPCRNTS